MSTHEQARWAHPGTRNAPHVLSAQVRGNGVVVHAEDIVPEVCRQTGVRADEIIGKSREERAMHAREMVIVLARELTLLSYKEISVRLLGRQNHTTSITAYYRAHATWTNEYRTIAEHAAVNLQAIARRRCGEALRT